jgi:hypothetical protein
MQNPPGVFACSPDGCTPFFRFVSICRTENDTDNGARIGIEVWESIPTLKPIDTGGDEYVENEIQTYALHMPCTTPSNGVAITKFSTYYKTRTVPIKKVSNEHDGDEKSETRVYNVYVPYSEIVDGIWVSRSRIERRSRLVSENEIPQTLEPLQRSKSYVRECLNFYDVDGRKLDVDDELESLDGYVPVIQIADPDHIAPYFSTILKPETRFLVIK